MQAVTSIFFMTRPPEIGSLRKRYTRSSARFPGQFSITAAPQTIVDAVNYMVDNSKYGSWCSSTPCVSTGALYPDRPPVQPLLHSADRSVARRAAEEPVFPDRSPCAV